MFRFSRELLRATRQAKGLPTSRLRMFTDMWASSVGGIWSDKSELVFSVFEEVWPSVRHAAGEDPAVRCLERARSGSPPACAAKYADEELRLLAGLCRQLQQEQGDAPFFLACRKAGELLGVNKDDASAYLRRLVRDGVLKVIERPRRNSRRAIRYRFLGGQ